MAVNKLSLRWPIHEGNMDRIRLWSWLKVRYESDTILDPLKMLYRDNIRSFKLKADGFLVD